LTNGNAGDVLRAMQPNLRADLYGDVLVRPANAIGAHISEAKGAALKAPVP
jgi:hypothetical protein